MVKPSVPKNLHTVVGKCFVKRADKTQKAILDCIFSQREVRLLVVQGKDKGASLYMCPHSLRKHWTLVECNEV